MKKRILVLFVVIIGLLLYSSMLFAQQIEVKGTVKDLKGKPIKATILVKSSKVKFNTDKWGSFTIQCNSKDKLKITAKDYTSKTIKVKGTKFFEVKLKKSGTDYSQYPSFTNIMTSLFSGSVVMENDEIYVISPETGDLKIPLLKLDGSDVYAVTLISMPTTTIKSIKVLRKTYETNIYGKEGLNGVIVVTTNQR